MTWIKNVKKRLLHLWYEKHLNWPGRRHRACRCRGGSDWRRCWSDRDDTPPVECLYRGYPTDPWPWPSPARCALNTPQQTKSSDTSACNHIRVSHRVPTLSLTKKIQDFPGPPWKIFQDLFGARECLNMKKKRHLLTVFTIQRLNICSFSIWTNREIHDFQAYFSRTFQDLKL